MRPAKGRQMFYLHSFTMKLKGSSEVFLPENKKEKPSRAISIISLFLEANIAEDQYLTYCFTILRPLFLYVQET